MKAIKHLLAASILAAVGDANAVTVHTTNLSGTQIFPDFIDSPGAPPNGIFGSYAYINADADGSADVNGGVFNGIVQFTTVFSSAVKANIGFQWTIDVAAGTATGAWTSCANLGIVSQCFTPPPPSVFLLDSYDFSNPANITWTAHLTEYSPQLLTVTTTFNWSGYAVPVPASAWLFGSGLLGLAGTTKRRRVA